MKQVMMCAIVVLAALPAMAAETLTDVYNFGTSGILWDSQGQCWTDHPTVEWTQSLDGLSDCAQVTDATLTINGCGIENVWWDTDLDGGYEQMDWVDVYFNGDPLGQLSGNSTTFNLDPTQIADAMNFGATITFQNDLWDLGDCVIDMDYVDSVYLNSSILSVTAATADCPPVAAVPVPGAFLLAGFGTLLVGTLRRRKAI